MDKTKTPTFEESMQRLEQIVRLLEKGDAPLEDAMRLFEEGTRLAGDCDRLLNEAEAKVMRLTRGADGQPEEAAFDAHA